MSSSNIEFMNQLNQNPIRNFIIWTTVHPLRLQTFITIFLFVVCFLFKLNFSLFILLGFKLIVLLFPFAEIWPRISRLHPFFCFPFFIIFFFLYLTWTGFVLRGRDYTLPPLSPLLDFIIIHLWSPKGNGKKEAKLKRRLSWFDANFCDLFVFINFSPPELCYLCNPFFFLKSTSNGRFSWYLWSLYHFVFFCKKGQLFPQKTQQFDSNQNPTMFGSFGLLSLIAL